MFGEMHIIPLQLQSVPN